MQGCGVQPRTCLVPDDQLLPTSLRVQPQPVRQQVEEQLRGAIISGTLAPGSHLSDRSLCEQFGVSRSIIREAVRLMEAEGLVTVVPYRGPFVAFLSAAEAAQVYEVRGALEALAGEGFAQRASDEERADLRRVYEELAATGPAAGREALLDLKRRFYDVLLRGSRNAYVGRMLGNCSTATHSSAPPRCLTPVACRRPFASCAGSLKRWNGGIPTAPGRPAASMSRRRRR